jgi:enoyl-CoA hydratase/carnithine racemase
MRAKSSSGGAGKIATGSARAAKEVKMANPDVLSTQIKDGIAVVILGSPQRIFFDPEMSDALLEALTTFANDEAVRVVVVTGGAPGYFVRHYSVTELVRAGERLQSSGQKWAEDTPYKPGSFASAMGVAE